MSVSRTDAGTKTSDANRVRSVTARPPHDNDEFRKLGRIQLWASQTHQTNHRMIRAFLLLEQDGKVALSALKEYCTRELNMANFDGNYASMKTDAGNSHGRVFFDDGTTVKSGRRRGKKSTCISETRDVSNNAST